MSDVARLAGVSHQTVSRVLNDHPNVRPATKERVLAAITELGYRRNSVARALARSRTEQLGIVVYGETIFGPVGSLVAIEDAAREAGYFLAVAPLHGSDDGGLGRAPGSTPWASGSSNWSRSPRRCPKKSSCSSWTNPPRR